ncbi:MAG: Modification methylase VspI [Candidatus Heimdallarchaeota archaeon LC_3]|nr:MAG: Modification methylase VspI [Candidatus Heimdallarchaeota archaeon LC_3]
MNNDRHNNELNLKIDKIKQIIIKLILEKKSEYSFVFINQKLERMENFNKKIFEVIYFLLIEVNSFIKNRYKLKFNRQEFTVLDKITIDKENVFNKCNDVILSSFQSNTKYIEIQTILWTLDVKNFVICVDELLNFINEESINRKALGAYFTPKLLSMYMVEEIFSHFQKKIHYKNNDLGEVIRELFTYKIQDPSIGSGNFIIQILEFYNSYLSEMIVKTSDNKTIENIVLQYILFINKNISGYDITYISLVISKSRVILSILNFLLAFIDKFNENILWNLLESPNITKNDILNVSRNDGNKYSIIIGNPPWGLSLETKKEKISKKFSVSNKQYDSWALFLEYGINNLDMEGILGFIVPNTILTNPNYSEIRKLILKKSNILEIVNLGRFFFPKVNQPALMLIIQKTDNRNCIRNSSSKIIPNISLNENFLLDQHNNEFWSEQSFYHEQFTTSWKNNKFFEFDIFVGRRKQFLHDIEKQNILLGEIVNNSRGVEIGKKGLVVVCSNCGKFHPPFGKNKLEKKCSYCESILKINKCKNENIIRRNLSEIEKSYQFRKIYFGEHIERFHAREPHYIIIDQQGINYKNEDLYLGPKILIAKTGHGLNAYNDESDTYTLQVVYIFKVKSNMNNNYSEWLLLGFLNSAVIYTYYYSKFSDPNRKIFPHLIQSNLLRIPIPKYTKRNLMLFTKIECLAIELQKNYNLHYLIKQICLHYKNKFANKQIISFKNIINSSNSQNENKSIFEPFQSKNLGKNLSVTITNKNSVSLGFINQNKFEAYIDFHPQSVFQSIFLYFLLKDKIKSLKLRKNLIEEILTKRIFIPSLNELEESNFQKDINNILNSHYLDNLKSLIKVLSVLINQELYLNELILQTYNMDYSKHASNLIYPY